MHPAADFLLLSALWGASFLFMRLSATEFGPVATAALRVGIGAACLLPLMLWRGQAAALRQHWRPVLLCGVLNSALPFALFSYAVLHGSTGLAVILNATTPLFGALVVWLWFGERPSAMRALGLVMGFAGVALLAWDKVRLPPGTAGAASMGAVAASLLAPLCYGLAAAFTRRYLTGVPPMVNAAGSQLGATLALAPLAVLWWPAHLPGSQAWLAAAALGVLCTGVAYVLFFRLIEKLGPARALTITFVTPVFAVVYGALLLNEPITLWMLMCGAIILAGTALSTGVLEVGRWKARAIK